MSEAKAARIEQLLCTARDPSDAARLQAAGELLCELEPLLWEAACMHHSICRGTRKREVEAAQKRGPEAIRGLLECSDRGLRAVEKGVSLMGPEDESRRAGELLRLHRLVLQHGGYGRGVGLAAARRYARYVLRRAMDDRDVNRHRSIEASYNRAFRQERDAGGIEELVVVRFDNGPDLAKRVARAERLSLVGRVLARSPQRRARLRRVYCTRARGTGGKPLGIRSWSQYAGPPGSLHSLLAAAANPDTWFDSLELAVPEVIRHAAVQVAVAQPRRSSRASVGWKLPGREARRVVRELAIAVGIPAKRGDLMGVANQHHRPVGRFEASLVAEERAGHRASAVRQAEIDGVSGTSVEELLDEAAALPEGASGEDYYQLAERVAALGRPITTERALYDSY